MSLVDALLETRSVTLPLYDLSLAELQKSYGPGKWTIKQLLIHLADAESVLHDRIRRVIAEPRHVIWAFDQDLWCQHLDYTHYPLELGKAFYLANRNAVIHLAGKYYESLGEKEFVHSQTGVRTLKDEFDKVVWHNQHHLEHVRQALATSTT